MPDIKFSKQLVFINCAVPITLLAWDGYYHRLGANPLEFITRTTGTLTLIFLLISLAVTPARKVLGQPWMVQLRKTLGLYAFFYGALHLLAYVWFDKAFHLTAIIDDTLKRRFIFFGMAGFLLLVPLAVTSTNAMIKRLGGRQWNRLHKIVYLSAIAGVLHYYLLVKADVRKPLIFAAVLAVLLGYRLLNRFFPDWTERRPARSARKPVASAN